MALHNNDGQGWKTIPDLIKAIQEIAPMFSATELRNTVTEMHNRGYVKREALATILDWKESSLKRKGDKNDRH